MLTSANSNDSIPQVNISEENMEQLVREIMLQKIEELSFSPSIWAWIFFGLLMLVLYCILRVIKKCCPRKETLKKYKRPKDNHRVKPNRKCLKEMLDELEALYPEDEDQDDKFGRILFKCNYEFKKEIFTIDILSAEDLLAVQAKVNTNAYVTIYLTPSRKITFKTPPIKRSNKPVWEERYIFENMPLIYLLQQTLVLKVRHDAFGIDPVLGVAYIPMKSIDLKAGTVMIYPLSPPQIPIKTATTNVGRIYISLRYVPTAAKLYVGIVEIDNLSRSINGSLANPYVKVVLYRRRNKIFKGKTSVKKQTIDPYFNESFIITMPTNFVETVELCISVMDKDKLSKNIIGYVRMGCSCKDLGLTHWLEVLANPRKLVTYWHKLKPHIEE